ncbi:hypothetical protein GGE65_002834 [Skermanella aerolata]|uniref:ImmA/IrrE family metallo-endopeptidase n=1 Tax=Skermanella aerolata TaxID=393310 RepID=UPI003D2351A9
MPTKFVMNAEWVACDCGLPEDRVTATHLHIAAGDFVATHIEDTLSHTVHDHVHVSAYPLALWFAANWWRLRWEPQSSWGEFPASWRMAHEMPAAGHGFIWPPVTFSSDGETIEVSCHPSRQKSPEPIRYLADFKATIEGNDFESTVDAFIDHVLVRLRQQKAGETDLSRLWTEVAAERQDPKERERRRLEAQLGFDPDEAPEQALLDLLTLREQAGQAALDEIAPTLPRTALNEAIQRTTRIATRTGTPACIHTPNALQNLHFSPGVPPWSRGRTLATAARRAWAITRDAVTDKELASLFDIPVRSFSPEPGTDPKAPFGLAVREPGDSRLKLLFKRRSASGRRFEAARFLADFLIAPATDAWLPATDTRTARQKVQRAFAAEFLCPIDSLQAFLNDDFSEDRIEEAADYFGVSALTAKNQLASHP